MVIIERAEKVFVYKMSNSAFIWEMKKLEEQKS